MGTKIMMPEVKVRLFKTISRRMVTTSEGHDIPVSERFSGGARVLDLTPFLGDGGSLTTSKSVRQPAGSWSITLADKMHQEKMDSLYGLIEPMDVIEIRLRHRPDPDATGAEPPVVMRGFVSTIGRSMSMSASGDPVRSVTISGQDYGKILELIQIRYLPNYVIGQNLLTELNLFVNYGVGAKPNEPGNGFLSRIVDKVINPFILGLAEMTVSVDSTGKIVTAADAGIDPMAITEPRTIKVEATATPSTISTFGAQSAQGTLWDILRQFLDVGPWAELFIEDRPDNMADPQRPGGVVLVYRNNPFMNLDPKKGFAMRQRLLPESLWVSDEEIIGFNLSRSDANVANYFQVNMPRMALQDAGAMNLNSQKNNPEAFFLANYPNATPKLYGMRFMEANTQMGGADSLGRIDGQSKEVVQAESKKSGLWIDQRREELMAMNKDNVVFEEGVITLRGKATLRPGMILTVGHHHMEAADGKSLHAFLWECYVVAVEHRFIPFQGYVSVATFERGTGFAERIRRAAGIESAYLAEWNQSGALGG